MPHSPSYLLASGFVPFALPLVGLMGREGGQGKSRREGNWIWRRVTSVIQIVDDKSQTFVWSNRVPRSSNQSLYHSPHHPLEYNTSEHFAGHRTSRPPFLLSLLKASGRFQDKVPTPLPISVPAIPTGSSLVSYGCD